MKKYYAILSLLCYCCVNILAQSSLQGIGVTKTLKDQKALMVLHSAKSDSKPLIKTYTCDTIYCTRTKKQHGWFAPMDTITKEAAQHRAYSLRFSKRNNAGHWEKYECLDAYGKYVKGAFSPYILRLGDAAYSDQKAKQEWVEKLNTICIYECVSDYTGETIVQERAYDENYNIVYTFSRVPIGANQYNGSYRDFNGLPAEMREDPGYIYGTIIRITEDRWGNDSVLQFFDAKGIAKLNADSAAREVYICDKDGHVLKQQSQNSDGSLAKDNWGNCGIEYKWNTQHQIISATYMDEYWRPMRMPLKRISSGRENVIRTNYRYDDYQRQKEEFYTDEKGNADVNSLGTHSIKTTYDNHGNNLVVRGYDKNNNVSPIDNSLAVVHYFNYNKDGRLISASFFDNKNHPCSTDGYLSSIQKAYNENGEEVLLEQYSAITGEEKLCYKNEQTPEYNYTLWDDGTSRVDSFDLRGRTTFVGFYDAKKKYEMTDDRAYERYTYVDQKGISQQTKNNYDEMGNKISTRITLIDSICWTRTHWQYDTNGMLIETFVHRYSPEFDKLIGQDDVNSIGIVSRSGGSSLVRYYKGNILYNQQGDITSIYGRDEFDEPDYIVSTSILYYYQKQLPHASTKYYDVNNKEIEDFDAIKNQLPKVMSIEVTDSIAYALGIKDNDVILLYGDYVVNLDTVVSYLTFKQDWTLRSVLDAQKEKRLVVFRITDATNNEYGIYEITGLKGTCSELGFIPHIRYLTDKQQNRIKETINRETEKMNPIVTRRDFQRVNNVGGTNYVVMAYTEMFRSNRNDTYAQQVTDPSILLGSCIKDRNLKWTKIDKNDVSAFETMLASRSGGLSKYPRQDFFVTKDGKSMIHIILDEQAIGTNWSDTYVSDEDYLQLTQLYNDAHDSIIEMVQQNTSINPKAFYGTWKNKRELGVPYQPEVTLSLSKNKTFETLVVTYGKISYTEGDAIYRTERKFMGTWDNGGNWLFFHPVEDSLSLSCVDLQGTNDEDLKQRAIAYLNGICNSNEDALLEQIEDESNIKGDLKIFFIDKKSFNARFASGSDMIFVKTKNESNFKKIKKHISPKEASFNRTTIDTDCPYVGYWESDIHAPNITNAHLEINLEPNGQFGMELSGVVSQSFSMFTLNMLLDVNLRGTWKPTSTGCEVNIDPSLLDINADLEIEGVVDETTKGELIQIFKTQMESEKQKFGLSFLKNLGNENKITLTAIDSMTMTLNDYSLTRVPNSTSIVIGKIEGDTGYLVKNGYEGLFIVLEWCNWNCKQNIDEYTTEFEMQRDNAKHLLLLPITTENDIDVFHDIIEINCSNEILGMRVIGYEVDYDYYKRNILSRYKLYKKNQRN